MQLGFNSDDTVKLDRYPNQPCIKKINKPKSVRFADEANYITNEQVIHQLRGVDPKYHNIIFKWNQEFPGVLDETLRNTSEKAKVMHRIDTGNALSRKTSLRRFSPPQEAALRQFVRQYHDKIIQKSKSSWASQALLAPKKNADGSPKTIWNAKRKR
ncbi:hypothetical protein K3495_g4401 [Podosphaera aphanis]|nr:hypothetical protein K3495_g4401 [Podosphaera aphanis]